MQFCSWPESDPRLWCWLGKTSPMKTIQEHLRQLLQNVSSSKMLPITLCLDALFGYFKQSANKPKSKMPVKKLHCTAQIQLLKRRVHIERPLIPWRDIADHFLSDYERKVRVQ